MADYITKIRTEKGDMQIDYNALANKPTKLPADGGNADTVDGKHADYFASANADGLKKLFAAGNTILSSYQYGSTLPAAGNAGRIFLKKVSK